MRVCILSNFTAFTLVKNDDIDAKQKFSIIGIIIMIRVEPRNLVLYFCYLTCCVITSCSSISGDNAVMTTAV